MGRGADKMAAAVELAKIIDATDDIPEAREQMGPHSSEFHHYTAFDNLILLAEVGSNITGVPRKQDTDQTGVCIEPPEVVLRINAMNTPAFEQYEYHSTGNEAANQKGDLDVTIYSLRKFARMAASGAPTGLVPLFVPQTAYEVSTTAGAKLRANRELFVTKQAGLKFAGMARHHQHRIKCGHGRKELLSKHGYDTDYAYHATRALMMGRDLMDFGELQLPWVREGIDHLRKVREGHYTKKQILKDIEEIGARMGESIEQSHLPEAPDYDKINDLIMEMCIDHWESGREY